MNVQATVDRGLSVMAESTPMTLVSLELLQTIIKKCPYHYELIGLWLDTSRHPVGVVSKMTHFFGSLTECLEHQSELHREHWDYIPAPSTANCQVADKR